MIAGVSIPFPDVVASVRTGWLCLWREKEAEDRSLLSRRIEYFRTFDETELFELRYYVIALALFESCGGGELRH